MKKPIRMSMRSKMSLLFFDGIFLILAIIAIYFFRVGSFSLSNFATGEIWVMWFVSLVSYYVFGAYEIDFKVPFLKIFLRQLVSYCLSLALIVFINFLIGGKSSGFLGRGVLLGSITLFFIFGIGVRFLLFQWFRENSSLGSWIFLTEKANIERIRNEVVRIGIKGRITFVDSENWQKIKLLEPNLKEYNAIVVSVRNHLIPEELGRYLIFLRIRGVSIQDFNYFYEIFWQKVPVEFLSHSWFALTNGFGLYSSRLNIRMKRLLDVAFSLFFFVVSIPVLICACIAISIDSKGGIIYRQTRSGLSGKNFTIYKLRTMKSDSEISGVQWARVRDPRVTRVGGILRLLRIDELPQLLNVILGDMSFIGPRPERPEFCQVLEEQIPFFSLRHSVRPGLTGWAQVMFPYGASIEDSKEKLEYDLFYIKNFSLILDLKILLKTIGVVLLGKGR